MDIQSEVDKFLSPIEWFENVIKQNRMTLLAFYRGNHDVFDQPWLDRFKELADVFYQHGGRIYCITSYDAVGTPPNHVKMDVTSIGMPVLSGSAKSNWKPSFPHFVDKNNSLANYFRWSITKHKNYPNGMTEAAYVIFTSERIAMMFWRSNPTMFNLYGGSGRPDPLQVMDGAIEVYKNYRHDPWSLPSSYRAVLG